MNRVYAILAVLVSGCYSFNGMIAENENVLKSLRETKVRDTRRPELTERTLSSVLEGTSLKFHVVQIATCESEQRNTYDNKMMVSKKLPWHHWLVLGTGAAMLGGGIAAWAKGSSLVDRGNAIDVGTPSQERDYDQGKRLVPWGIGLASIGGVLVSSDIVDLFMSIDEEEQLEQTEEVVDLGLHECGREPAELLSLVLSQGSSPVHSIRLDREGSGQVELGSRKIKSLPFRVPFLVAKCERCNSFSFALPPDMAANLVLSHNSLSEYREWLAAFPAHSRTEAIRHAYLELIGARLSRYLDRANALLKQAEFSAARTTIDECVSELKQDFASDCAAVGAIIDNRHTKNLVREGRTNISKMKYADAVSNADRCLSIDPNRKPCIRMKGDAYLAHSKQALRVGAFANAIALAELCQASDSARSDCKNANASATARYEEVRPFGMDVAAYEESDGYRYYFTIRNASDRPIAIDGKAICFLSVFQSGLRSYAAPLSSFDVDANDFDVRSVGRGAFARSKLLVDRFVRLRDIYTAVAKALGNIHRAAVYALHNLRYDQSAFIECVFQDMLGNEVSGRDEVWFR
jgi:tetratricopeptide (TPR) repeat protein